MLTTDCHHLRRHLAQHLADYTSASDAFYSELFAQLPELTNMFGDDPAKRRRKFISIISTVVHLKDLEAMRPAIRSMGARHAGYGARAEHYAVLVQAFLDAIRVTLGERLDASLMRSWRHVLEALAAEMLQAYDQPDVPQQAPLTLGSASQGQHSLLQRLGGAEVILQVHLSFYSTIFNHPWLGEFFYGKSQTALAKKQTSFMVACLGGNEGYQGETPATAHMHMYITREMLLEREQLLRNAIHEHGIPPALAEEWLEVDRSFWGAIEKGSAEECVTTCPGQMPIIIKDRSRTLSPAGGSHAQDTARQAQD